MQNLNHEAMMFFGKRPSIARLDQLKYPFFQELTEKQRGFFWRPQEVEVNRDAKDFKSLMDNEKHIFTSNLKRQILLDSVQGRCPVEIFGPLTSLPEMEVWMRTWSMFEDIHSFSYQYIIDNVYPNASMVYDGILDIPEILACDNDISYYYKELEKNPSSANLWLALNAVNVLEGIRFYVSFACSWAFAETKRMEGNAKIIKFICFDDQTDILTNSGWKRFADLDKTELVAQYTQDGSVEFVRPLNYIEEDCNEPLYHFSNSRYDFAVTGEHRVIFKQDDTIEESLAKNFNPSCVKYIIASGEAVGQKEFLSTEDQFRIAVQADGHVLAETHNGELSNTKPVTFNLTKYRKKNKLRALLATLGFEYTETKKPKGVSVFYVKVPLSFDVEYAKFSFGWVDLENISAKWARSFLAELIQWDGYIRTDYDSHILYYSTINPNCADMVQAIAALSGWKHHRGLQKDNRKASYNDVHRLTVNMKTDVDCAGDKHKVLEMLPYSGKVYCVTVPSGMVVVRRNNKVCVSGNCRDENLHLAGTQQMLRLLPKESSHWEKIESAQRFNCVAIFESAVKQEKEWAKYLFKDGSIIGLNEELLCDYVEWIAHKRMLAIGLPSPFKGGSNPLPWTEKWIRGQDVQVAPQEVQISSYTIGGIRNDVEESTFKNFDL